MLVSKLIRQKDLSEGRIRRSARSALFLVDDIFPVSFCVLCGRVVR